MTNATLDPRLLGLRLTEARKARGITQEAAAAPYPTGPNMTPAGFSIFPKEAVRASRRWIEKRYATVLHFNELEHGGHFAALEQPVAFAQELQATFRASR